MNLSTKLKIINRVCEEADDSTSNLSCKAGSFTFYDAHRVIRYVLTNNKLYLAGMEDMPFIQRLVNKRVIPPSAIGMPEPKKVAKKR